MMQHLQNIDLSASGGYAHSVCSSVSDEHT